MAPGAVLGLIFSVAADHTSRRLIAAGGALAYAVSLAIFAAAASAWWLVLAAFLMGMAATAMIDAVEVALVDMAGNRLRPYLARADLGGVIGDLAGPLLLGAVLAVGWSWRAAFALAALAMGLYGVVPALARLPVPAGRPDETDAPPRRVVRSMARDRRVWVMGLLLAPFDEPFLGFLTALAQSERGPDRSRGLHRGAHYRGGRCARLYGWRADPPPSRQSSSSDSRSRLHSVQWPTSIPSMP